MGIKIKRYWWRSLFAHRKQQTVTAKLVRSTVLIVTAGVLAIPVGLWQIFDASPNATAGTPTISAVTPSSGDPSGGTTVTISGSNFTANKVTALANGATHSCAIASGTAYCWGANDHGQLGNNSTTESTVPVAVDTSGVLNGKTITAITAGLNFSCALDDSGSLYCWGINDHGQLGNNSTTESTVPVAVDTSGLSGTVTSLSSGEAISCAIANGTAYCWGENDHGQLGNNSTTESTVPVAVDTSGVLNSETLTTIAVGNWHACTLATSGSVYCWGFGGEGSLGNNSTTDSLTPVTVDTSGVLNNKTVTTISSNDNTSCVLDSAGKAYCWGFGNEGQLGNNATANSSSPVAVDTSGVLNNKTLTKLSVGKWYACAVDTNGKSYCWGDNSDGQLGNSSTTDSPTPVAVTTSGILSGKALSVISTGGSASCAADTNGVAYCWGDNSDGQLGNSSTTDSHVPITPQPTLINQLPTVTFGAVNATNVTYNDTASLTAVIPAHAEGAVDVKVINPNGQTTTYTNGYFYGTPPPSVTSVTPNQGSTVGGTSVTINGRDFMLDNVQKIDTKMGHTCALTVYHKLYCWGYGSNGELGNNTANNSSTPVAVDTTGVLNGKTITDLSVGGFSACVVASGKVYCWGSNTTGQLGVNSSSPTKAYAPVAVYTGGVLSGKTITNVSVGMNHACALDSTGKVYCWGGNANGQVGNGTYTSIFWAPVAVYTSGALSGKTVTKISAGGSIVDSSSHGHTCAIANSQAYCWGAGQNGQLGNGSTLNSSEPVVVSGMSGKTVTDISAGISADSGVSDAYYTHNCLIADGTVYCWGYNDYGQLGDSTTTRRTTPTSITSGASFTSVAVGDRQTCAISTANSTYCWGYNGGSFGNNSTTNSSSPLFIPAYGSLTGKTIASLSAGYGSTCGIDTSNAAHCWGYNDAGALGDGTINDSIVPVAVDTSLIDSVPTVSFGGSAATDVSYVSPTQLTATTPAHAAGAVNVTVTNVDQQTGTLANAYTYQPPATVPDAPTNLVAIPAANGVSLTWNAPSNNGGAAISDYKLEYSDNGGSSWQTFTHSASSATSQTISGLSGGVTYRFRVSAVNYVGASSPSGIATGSPLSITLTAPTSASITVSPHGTSTVSSSSSTISVTTNSTTGYRLLLESSGASRNLVNGTENLTPSTGTLLDPANLLINTWGYRVDNVGGFGSTTTVPEINTSSSGYTWAGIPTHGSPDTIHTAPSAVTDDTTTVWYAMMIDNSKPSGTYSNTVLYTAVAG